MRLGAGDRDHRTLAAQLSGTFAIFGALALGGILATALTCVWILPDQNRVQLAVSGESAALVIAWAATLDLAVFVAALVFAGRQRRALCRSITGPVAALLHRMGDVRDGHLETVAEPAGPAELRKLGEGFNEMVGALKVAQEAAASRDELARGHSARLRGILEASREFSESLNLAYVVGAVRQRAAAIGGYERVVVWLMDDELKWLVDGDSTTATLESAVGRPTGLGLAGRAAKAGRTCFEGPAGDIRFTGGDVGSICAMAIPLIVGARVAGVLEVRSVVARATTIDTIDVLETLATHAATAIESARLHESIEERSYVDSLTQLLNRRRLDEDLDVECKRCLRYGRPLSFVMLDVDHFKAFNDAHGHPAADKALQEMAAIMRSCVRATDTAYRYGGEEFCVILRETSGTDAVHFAERVRLCIEQHFAEGLLAGLTASFGVTDFSAETPTPQALVGTADAALYESKHAGRNRVVLSLRPLFVLNGEFAAQSA